MAGPTKKKTKPNGKRSLRERFFALVDQSAGPTACWRWKGYRERSGRGKFQISAEPGGAWAADRVCWVFERGPLLDCWDLMPTCERGNECINPAHRVVVPKKRKASRPVKLNDAQHAYVLFLKTAIKLPNRAIADKLNLDISTVQKIVANARNGNLPEREKASGEHRPNA